MNLYYDTKNVEKHQETRYITGMRILAIETSCDETAISIIEKRGAKFFVLANIVSSQAKVHAAFGGVVPNLAHREHQKNLVPVLIAALKEARLYAYAKDEVRPTLIQRCIKVLEHESELQKSFLKIFTLAKPAIDAIAITEGPGLEPALWVGINFAKALSMIWAKPLIPINHMEGHIYSALIGRKNTELEARNPKKNQNFLHQNNFEFRILNLKFPTIALLVSGGHTELIRIKKLGRYEIIGETVDDAAGEAFDKVAKMLKLGYPGGPIISRLAEKGNARAINFPRPMMNAANFNFSFSGLKTSVLYYLRDHTKLKALSYKLKADIAASFQQAAIDVLVSKTKRALHKYKAQSLILGGGVAANKLLRMSVQDACAGDGEVFLPDPKLTGDNALMIALAAFFRKKKSAQMIGADGNMRLS